MNRKRMMIIGAILLIVGGTSAYGIWQVEKPGGLVWQDGFKYKQLGKISQYDYSSHLPADSATIRNMSIRVENCDVTITKGTAFRVTATKYASKVLEKLVSVTFKDGTLSIEENRDQEGTVVFGVNNFSQKINIEIPEDSQLATVEAKNKSGDLKVKNLKQVDSLVASSDNGAIKFENIAAKYAKLSSENGDISIKYTSFDRLSANNLNGNIEFKKSHISNGGDISNQNGDIKLDKTALPTFYAATLNGDKEIKRSQASNEISKAAAALHILNHNGDIEID
ncbi:DUF4097 domain-containing protein [Lactococcus piscium]|uniref:DUF4097 family beta strand repeat-containing protein n=1 Tax=Pseudolactococcus carnosus TaxID=2749961 RepID=UPI001FBAEC27|nr:DUF4097 family beta strand repeat-containing protein [Lactococcus carnosus]MCJ1995831.1 DUF4097 domain-containing protein [Lactococcus carnosus]